MSDRELELVYETPDESAAEVIRIALEDAGYRCFLENQRQGGYAGVLPVRVFVPTADAAAARKLLNSIGFPT